MLESAWIDDAGYILIPDNKKCNYKKEFYYSNLTAQLGTMCTGLAIYYFWVASGSLNHLFLTSLSSFFLLNSLLWYIESILCPKNVRKHYK